MKDKTWCFRATGMEHQGEFKVLDIAISTHDDLIRIETKVGDKDEGSIVFPKEQVNFIVNSIKRIKNEILKAEK